MAPAASAPAARPKPIPGPQPQPRPQRASAGAETATVPRATTVAKISAVLLMGVSLVSDGQITLLLAACFITFSGFHGAGSASSEPTPREGVFYGMGPGEQDNDVLLLVVVSLICATLVGILEFGSTKSAVAARPTVVASEEPVR